MKTKLKLQVGRTYINKSGQKVRIQRFNSTFRDFFLAYDEQRYYNVSELISLNHPDTTTTEGKREVMEDFEVVGKVLVRRAETQQKWNVKEDPNWNWSNWEYKKYEEPEIKVPLTTADVPLGSWFRYRESEALFMTERNSHGEFIVVSGGLKYSLSNIMDWEILYPGEDEKTGWKPCYKIA